MSAMFSKPKTPAVATNTATTPTVDAEEVKQQEQATNATQAKAALDAESINTSALGDTSIVKVKKALGQ